MGNSFTEDDLKNLVNYVNFVAKKAKFEMDTEEAIKYFNLISSLQHRIIPKVEAHIWEIQKLTQVKDKPKAKSKRANSKSQNSGDKK